MQAKWVLFVNGGVHLPAQSERSRGMKANKGIHLVSGYQSLMLLRCFRSMRAALRRLPVKNLQGENAPLDVLILKFIVYALSAAGRNDSRPSNFGTDGSSKDKKCSMGLLFLLSFLE